MMTNTVSSTNQNSEGQKVISSVGMIIALVSFGMLFATLMMGFAMYRFSSPVWPPAGMTRPSLLLPAISTLIIFLSSLCYLQFEKKITDKKFLLATFALGLGFMFVQSLLWNHLKTQGLTVSSGLYPSIIYSFTWIHAAHIVVAIGLLVWLLLTRIEHETVSLKLKVSSVGKFWHFLGIVWLIMFVTIFVL